MTISMDKQYMTRDGKPVRLLCVDAPGICAPEYGMSLRDYFAGHAVGAVIAATSAGQHNPRQRAAGDTLEDMMAADAYAIADAMIAQRDKGGASLQH